MKRLDLGRSALSCAAFALLAACSGSQLPIGGVGAMPQSLAVATHAERGGSWMLPDAKRSDLLYISSEADRAVYVLTYPQAKLVGTLAGFTDPGGLCSDKNGNVFVPDGEGQDIVEYAHGQSNPVTTLPDSGYVARDCSVDATTGNLAVANLEGVSGTNGNVAIYQGEQSPPQFVSGTMQGYWACGYDDKSDLFTLGGSDSSDFSELPNGSSAFIDLHASFLAAWGVKWDGQYLAISGLEQNQAVIKRVAVSGSSVQVVKQVVLKKGTHKVYIKAFWIQKGTLIGGFGTYLAFWKYPSGGLATRSVHLKRFQPRGVTVSVAPQR